MNEPKLNLLFPDTNDSKTFMIADISEYPENFNISNPTIEITPPGFPAVTLPFPPKGIQVYNSDMLEITCGDIECDEVPLPDGIYYIKYSIFPNYKYYVEKSILYVNNIIESLDKVWLKVDLMECDMAIKAKDKKILELIEAYINGAIAAANNCLDKLAMKLYNKAAQLIDDFINNKCCLN